MHFPLLSIIAMPLLLSCQMPGQGYRTSSVPISILAAAEVAVQHPEMVRPRSDETQDEMEEEADDRLGPQVVPEALLIPDIFSGMGQIQ